MQYIVNANEMKEIDQYTINHVKIPSMVLMERAALSVVHHMMKVVTKEDKILVICGTGNNGGDGLAIARILHEKGLFVHVLLLGCIEKASDGFLQQYEILRNLDVYMNNNLKVCEYNIIVDAIFGIGLSKPITGEFASIIDAVNQANNLIFSVDIPSGVSADEGKIRSTAMKADYTITFGLNKLGLILYPGCEYAGKVYVEDIGFPKKVIDYIKPKTFIYGKEDLNLLPVRNNYSNKGTFGKVLIIAGSKNMSGACYLSAKAAYRMGAGLVKVLTVEENRTIIQSTLPEAIFSTYDSDLLKAKAQTNRILDDMKWADVIVIGPGMGVSKTSEYLLELLLNNIKVPIIIDADALNLLAKKMNHNMNQDKDNIENIDESIDESFNENIDESMYECIDESIIDNIIEDIINNIDESMYESYNDNINEIQTIDLPSNVIITPHLKEMARLLNKNVTDIADHLVDTACLWVSNHKHILALKDARTVVTDGEHIYLNTSGNSAMAKAGSGDVLTGIIAGLLAQGLEPFQATSLSVYIHGLAADFYVESKSKYSLLASDLIDSLSQVLK